MSEPRRRRRPPVEHNYYVPGQDSAPVAPQNTPYDYDAQRVAKMEARSSQPTAQPKPQPTARRSGAPQKTKAPARSRAKQPTKKRSSSSGCLGTVGLAALALFVFALLSVIYLIVCPIFLVVMWVFIKTWDKKKKIAFTAAGLILWFVALAIVSESNLATPASTDTTTITTPEPLLTPLPSTTTEKHLYDNAQVKNVMNGFRTAKIGEYSLIWALSSEVTVDSLADWYFNYVSKNDFNWCMILYTDRDDNLGVYGNNGLIEKDIYFEQDEYGDYSTGDHSISTIYAPTSNGTLILIPTDSESENESSPGFTSQPTAEPTPTPLPTLKQGMSGDDVKQMQQALIRHGYLNGTADGSFGSGTADAVKTFQKKNGLSADGVAGAQTLSLLYSGNVVRQTWVWIPTKGGTKFHLDQSCSDMDKPQRVLIEDAKAKGFDSCAKCAGGF